MEASLTDRWQQTADGRRQTADGRQQTADLLVHFQLLPVSCTCSELQKRWKKGQQVSLLPPIVLKMPISLYPNDMYTGMEFTTTPFEHFDLRSLKHSNHSLVMRKATWKFGVLSCCRAVVLHHVWPLTQCTVWRPPPHTKCLQYHYRYVQWSTELNWNWLMETRDAPPFLVYNWRSFHYQNIA